jgi:hypothetical protein
VKTIKTKVNCIECPKCGDIIYSRVRHDFHYCACETIAIDGGFDYMRVLFIDNPPKKVVKYINATKQELYDDWNNNIDKFGWLKKEK